MIRAILFALGICIMSPAASAAVIMESWSGETETLEQCKSTAQNVLFQSLKILMKIADTPEHFELKYQGDFSVSVSCKITKSGDAAYFISGASGLGSDFNLFWEVMNNLKSQFGK
ncbi:MAG: hypothetical protein R8L07_13750 [Alphaproteobacteria bacterium]|nr:hypothetical protein [Alphaproteobacteria bacterium]